MRMRIRGALVGAALGGALLLGGTGPTHAAESVSAPAAAAVAAGQTDVEIMASWHFYRAY